MIKRLQRMRAKGGFTLIELIVVLAIIAVLSAVIFSSTGSQREEKIAANTYARNFYSAVQTCFTKYMRYEAALSTAMKSEEDIIKYFNELSGNYPVNEDTYIEMYVRRSEIEYVHVSDSMLTLLNDSSTTINTEFESILANDIESYMGTDKDGYFFASVSFSGASSALTSTTETVKVKWAYYTDTDLPTTLTFDTTYINSYLLFKDDNVLASGEVCGVCTDEKDSTGRYIGTAGTMFMDIT